MKKILLTLAGLIVLLVVIITALLVYTTATESGLQALLALGKKTAPGELQWNKATGNLTGPLNLHDLSYQQENGLKIQLQTASFDWQPKALLSRQLQIEHLHLDGLDVYLPEPAQPKEEKPTGETAALPEIHLPIDIDSGDIDLHNIRIYPYEAEKPIEIERLQLTATAQDDTFNIRHFNLKMPEAHASLTGSVQPAGDYPLDLTLGWRYEHPEFGGYAGKAKASGDLNSLKLTHDLSGTAQGTVNAELSNLIEQPGWDAVIDIAVDDPSQFSPQLEHPVKAHIKSKGNLTQFTTSGQVQSELSQTGPLDFIFNAQGDTTQIKLEKALLNLNNKAAHIKLHGTVDIASQAVDLQGDWDALRWPMTDEKAQYASPSGKFKVAGLVSDYTFKLNADTNGVSLPKGSWNLTGDGSDQALSQFNLNGNTLDGTLKLNGKATWKPAVTWQVELDSQHLNPGKQWHEMPGKINALITSTGQLTDDGPDLAADIAKISGKLRGQKLHGQGQIKMQRKTLDVDQLDISLGKTRLNVDGKLGDLWDLNWKLAAPDLAQLAPELKGSIKADGSFHGTPEQSQTAMNLDIRKLAMGENQIERLRGKANIDLSGGKQSALNFHGSNLLLGGQQWNTLKLNGSGTPEKHKLKFNLNGKLAQLEAALGGGLKAQQWLGQLKQLAARKTEFGDWILKQPAVIRVDKAQFKTKPICLSSDPTLVCLSANRDANNETRGELTLKALEAKRFKRFLPEGMQLDTALNGEAHGSLDAQGKPQARANFVLRPGEIILDSGDEPATIALGKSTIKARLENDQGSAKLFLNLGKLGKINAQTEVAGLQTTQHLSGNFQTQLNDLSLVSAFTPQLQAVEGNLGANLQLSGTLKSPGLSGELRLSDFSAEVPEIAIHIKDTQLLAQSDGKGPLLIEGSSHSGEGKMKLSGQLDSAKKALQLKITGDRFQASNSSLAEVEISPDLQIKMNSKLMKVSGEVLIPKAHIKAGGAGGEEDGGGGVVSASKDVVMVDENGEPEQKQQASNLALNVRVVLGDDIKVNAAEFNGELEGSLLVEQTPQLAPRGTGTIKILNGDFLVYGQQLKMQRGQVLFSGGPVDNPKLDMDVARRVEEYNVLAGAKIRGTVQAPLMQLYSEPSMPDASILSYILIGQPPGAKAGTYTVGKHITPDLYVSYGIALFNAISSFNMRYKLTDKLSLKAASGAASSADLIYTFER